MKVVRYPVKALLADYFRAGIGLSVGLGVLVSVPPSPVILLVFGGLSAVFGVFGFRTLRRHVTTISIGDAAIGSQGLGACTLPWHELEMLKLRYYGSRRQRSRGEGEGFMQLTLCGAGASLTLESSVEGFEYIVWRAAKAARDNRVALDQTSAGNLLDIGIDADAEEPAPDLGAGDSI
jgi:hypothetical protein